MDLGVKQQPPVSNISLIFLHHISCCLRNQFRVFCLRGPEYILKASCLSLGILIHWQLLAEDGPCMIRNFKNQELHTII